MVEALLLAATGSPLATAAGLTRAIRHSTRASARAGTGTFATSDEVVIVEGNAYFPMDSVPDGVLQPSATTRVCPWKGVASYHDVHVDDQVIPDGAWTYRTRSPWPGGSRVGWPSGRDRRRPDRVPTTRRVNASASRTPSTDLLGQLDESGYLPPRHDTRSARCFPIPSDYSTTRDLRESERLHRPSCHRPQRHVEAVPEPSHTDGLIAITAHVLLGWGRRWARCGPSTTLFRLL